MKKALYFILIYALIPVLQKSFYVMATQFISFVQVILLLRLSIIFGEDICRFFFLDLESAIRLSFQHFFFNINGPVLALDIGFGEVGTDYAERREMRTG